MRAFKNIIFIGILVAALLVSSAWIIGFMHSNDSCVNNRFKTKLDLAKEADDTVDILVLGDSLSFSSFSPMVLWENQGTTAYVCGQSSQRIDEAYNMLKYAYGSQSPSLVILETNTLFRNNDFITWKNYDAESALQSIFPIMEVHDIWKCLFFNKQYSEQFIKGFILKTKVEPFTGGLYMTECTDSTAVDDNIAFYMDKIIKLCQKHHSQLLLVSAPSPKNYSYAKHNGLVNFSKEKDLDYLDLNLAVEDIGIDWNIDTMDAGDHLNWVGADKVSQYLGKYLQENYSLTDHRADDAYASWREAGVDYDEKYSDAKRTVLGQ